MNDDAIIPPMPNQRACLTCGRDDYDTQGQCLDCLKAAQAALPPIAPVAAWVCGNCGVDVGGPSRLGVETVCYSCHRRIAWPKELQT